MSSRCLENRVSIWQTVQFLRHMWCVVMSLSYLIVIVKWALGPTLGNARVEQKLQTHTFSLCDRQLWDLIFFSTVMWWQGQRVSRPVLTSVGAWHDKVTAYWPARVNFNYEANTCPLPEGNMTLPGNFTHRVYKFPNRPPPRFLVQCKSWRQTDRKPRSTTPSMPQHFEKFSFKEARRLRSEREGIPFHPQSVAVVLLNINFHPGTRSGHSPVGTPHQDGIWYLAILLNECMWGTGTWNWIC